MPNIKVKAVEGRVAFTAPVHGRKIPTDAFISVPETPWIRRLLDFHGDIVTEGGGTITPPPSETPSPTPPPVTPPLEPIQ